MAMADNDIKSASDILSVMSGDKELKQLAEMREKALMDEASRISGAIKKGREDGLEAGRIEVAKNLLDILDDETIAKKTGLDIMVISKLRKDKKR